MEEVLSCSDLDTTTVKEALKFMSKEAMSDLLATRDALEKISDILGNPSRVAREAERG